MATFGPIFTPRRCVPDIVVCDSSALLALAAFTIRQNFVVVVAFGVAGDDVPGVEQAGEVAEHAEEDVD